MKTAGRYLICAAGFVVLCFGIVLNTKTGLGVAPINSVPYFISEISPLTLGQVTMIMYLIFIAAQCVMRRKVEIRFLLQLPVSVLFGQLVDIFNHLLNFYAQNWPEALLLLLAANVFTALGIVMVVGMNLVANAPDGFVAIAAETFHKPFGLTKNIFDITMAVITTVASLTMTHRLIGIGLGTVVTALLCGRLAALFRKLLQPMLKLGVPAAKNAPPPPAAVPAAETVPAETIPAEPGSGK